MRTFILAAICLFLPLTGIIHAGDMREIELVDGSTITGEVLSLSNKVYTIKSDTLGTMKIEESKIRAIRFKPPAGGNTQSLQDKMMRDEEIMARIQSLQNDPEFQEIVEDPDVMKAINSGDLPTLMANPRFMRLLNHSAVQDIRKKVGE